MDKHDLGRRFRYLLHQANYTIPAYAELHGIDKSAVASWCKGYHYPSVRQFVRICCILNVHPEWLLCMRDDPYARYTAVPTIDDISNKISAELLAKKDAEKLTLYKMSQALGTTPSVVGQYMNEHAFPSLKRVVLIAQYVQCPLEKLLVLK